MRGHNRMSCQDSFDERSQHTFSLRNNKNYLRIITNTYLIWNYGKNHLLLLGTYIARANGFDNEMLCGSSAACEFQTISAFNKTRKR